MKGYGFTRFLLWLHVYSPQDRVFLTPGLQLVALLGKVVEPLGGRALLGEVGV